MVLTCSACSVERNLSEAFLEQLEVDRYGRIQCPECGVFEARVQPHAQRAPPLQDLGELTDGGWAGRPLRLRRGSREFKVRDLDRLRRLIIERKAAGSDLVSTDGVRWVPVSSVTPLEPYLAGVRFLDSGPRTGGGGVLVEATAAEDGWGDDPTDEIQEPTTSSTEPS